MSSRRTLLLDPLILASGLCDAQQAPRVIGMLLPWKDSTAREVYDALVQEMLAVVAARRLRGEKASDLPIQQPTKTELVINRKTADALGLKIAPALLLQADRIVE